MVIYEHSRVTVCVSSERSAWPTLYVAMILLILYLRNCLEAPSFKRVCKRRAIRRQPARFDQTRTCHTKSLASPAASPRLTRSPGHLTFHRLGFAGCPHTDDLPSGIRSEKDGWFPQPNLRRKQECHDQTVRPYAEALATAPLSRGSVVAAWFYLDRVAFQLGVDASRSHLGQIQASPYLGVGRGEKKIPLPPYPSRCHGAEQRLLEPWRRMSWVQGIGLSVGRGLQTCLGVADLRQTRRRRLRR